MRKLASVQTIINTAPIEGADNIEVAFVLGWQVVVKKGEYKAGDLVVFYEIDSFLPASDIRYESFKERFSMWEGVSGMRLKTIKLRKTLSQGLVMPFNTFPEIAKCKIGDDVTDLLKIQKWEIKEKVVGVRTLGSGKSFPSFIPKTDQERVQNYGAIVEKHLDDLFEVTMKKDGSSMTVFVVQPNSKYYNIAQSLYKTSLFDKIKAKVLSWLGKRQQPIIGICSRNLLLPLDGKSLFHKVSVKYDLVNKLIQTGGSFALQGELVAPSIQDNHEKVKEEEFHTFDLFDIDEQKYLLPNDRSFYCHAFSIPHATVLSYTEKLKDIIGYKDGDNIVDKCLTFAEGKGDNEGVKREGVVFKHMNKDFSFKAISNSYLLKKG